MTPLQTHRLDQLIQVIRESAERIIDDEYTERELLLALYQKGFTFLSDQGDQALVDIGSVGLAYAVKRATRSEGDGQA